MDNSEIAGLTILYTPTDDNIKNIFSYIEQCHKVYIFDNSSKSNWKSIIRILWRYLDKIEYFPNFQNKGLPYCLNIGIEKAIAESYTWLLTMDQDSIASRFMISELIETTLSINCVALLSPAHVPYEGFEDEIYENEIMLMSGNLLNLTILRKEKFLRFDEKLFVDKVDDDFCLTLLEAGYRTIQNKSIRMKHTLGVNGRFILGSYVSNHSPIRRYYITRNTLYISKKHSYNRSSRIKYLLKQEKTSILKDIIKVLLLEKMKIRKMVSIILAIRDFTFNRMGKRIIFWIV